MRYAEERNPAGAAHWIQTTRPRVKTAEGWRFCWHFWTRVPYRATAGPDDSGPEGVNSPSLGACGAGVREERQKDRRGEAKTDRAHWPGIP